jgi:hypothetical protein
MNMDRDMDRDRNMGRDRDRDGEEAQAKGHDRDTKIYMDMDHASVYGNWLDIDTKRKFIARGMIPVSPFLPQLETLVPSIQLLTIIVIGLQNPYMY